MAATSGRLRRPKVEPSGEVHLVFSGILPLMDMVDIGGVPVTVVVIVLVVVLVVAFIAFRRR